MFSAADGGGDPDPAVHNPERAILTGIGPVQFVAERGAITNGDVRRMTGLSRFRALGRLQQLSADGLLRITGSRRGARYVAGSDMLRNDPD